MNKEEKGKMKREKSKTGRYSLLLFSLLSFIFSLSCGLEEYIYIDYISESRKTDNTSASIQLPSSSNDGYGTNGNFFTHFEIYYRIYISDVGYTSIIDTSQMSSINSALYSDYTSLYYLTNKTGTSSNPSNLETVFSNRRYFKLNLEYNSIDDILGRGSLGQTLEISFGTNGVKPVLKLNGVSYPLQRAVSGPGLIFTPIPDRTFFNSSELCKNANVTNESNADVAANTQTGKVFDYTYVSMYIFAIGRDYITTIYSQPTHINIFRLPN